MPQQISADAEPGCNPAAEPAADPPDSPRSGSQTALECLARVLDGEECAGKATAESPSVTVSPPTVHGAGRILLVEDTPLNQRVAAGMLREIGYAVDIAASGPEALVALERQEPGRRYALVLMDCQMPEMDGFQTTTEIRRREAGRSPLPIIAMTASAMAGDRERCLRAGMNDYLAKPVTLDELAEMLHRWVSIRPSNGHAGHTDDEALHGARKPRVSYLEQLRGRPGGAEAVRKLVAQFRADTPVYITTMRVAAGEHDPATIQRAAHSLRGSALLIGAPEVVDLAVQLEHLAGSGTTRGAGDLIDRLDAALARVGEPPVTSPAHDR